MAEEIRVRIAVAVDPQGGWCAAGWGVDGESDNKRAMDMALDGVSEGEARYWVEAVLVVPSVPTVTAHKVEPGS